MRSRTTGMTVIYLADNKSKDCLHPYIIQNIKAGSTVYSDKMASYVTRSNKSLLETYNFNHFWINHSLNYVDRESPISIQITLKEHGGVLKNLYLIQKDQ